MDHQHPVKKKWVAPQLILIDTAGIESGAQPSYHEKTLESVFNAGGIKIGHIKNGPIASNGGIYTNANIS